MRENVCLEAIQVVVSGGEKRGEKTNKAALQTFQNGGDDSKSGGPLIVVQYNAMYLTDTDQHGFM